MRATFARLVLKLIRWSPVGSKPVRGSVIVCAPHTSNLDYVLMMLVAWTVDMNLSFLGKTSLFKPPLGWLMRATGGIAVDRTAPNGLVGQLAEAYRDNPDLMLAVPAEGTRGRTEHWKSGFYRIATEAGVPICLAFIDKATRTSGFGPVFEPSGDLAADMEADLTAGEFSELVVVAPPVALGRRGWLLRRRGCRSGWSSLR